MEEYSMGNVHEVLKRNFTIKRSWILSEVSSLDIVLLLFLPKYFLAYKTLKKEPLK